MAKAIGRRFYGDKQLTSHDNNLKLHLIGRLISGALRAREGRRYRVRWREAVTGCLGDRGGDRGGEKRRRRKNGG